MSRESDDDTTRASEPAATAGAPASQPPPAAESRRKRFEHLLSERFDQLLPELIKRGIEKGFEAGMGTLSRTDEALRGVVAEGKLPREIVSYVFTAIDDTKNGMMRVVGREVRDFLQATDLSKEFQKALTSLSFEIKTEIRFIPNDAGTGVKADIKAGSTTVKRNSTPPPPPDEPGETERAHDGEPSADPDADSATSRRRGRTRRGT